MRGVVRSVVVRVLTVPFACMVWFLVTPCVPDRAEAGIGQDTSLAYRESFESGVIDWEGAWDTYGGMDRYTDRYRIDRLRPGFLVHDRCSYYCSQPHDYLMEQIHQIVKPCRENGFWEPEQGRWICRLLWHPDSGWYAHVPHDWKYSIELQEGALMAAMITGCHAMDTCLAGELRYIHTRLGSDGRFDGYDIRLYTYEYGLVLSALALGAQYFMNNIQYIETARDAYDDMKAMYVYATSSWCLPATLNPDAAIVLRGYVNAARAFAAFGENRYAAGAAARAREIEALIVASQNAEGRFDVVTTPSVDHYPVQNQLKASIGLMLAYQLTGDAACLEAASRNLDWVIANRWDISGRRTGGLYWSAGDRDNFFECHQMWFLIAAKYIEQESGCDYACHRADALAFLTDDNFAGVDMYVHNRDTYGPFFAYRAISQDGTIQKDPFHQFKGAYEIGASLWGMALLYDEWNAGHARLVTQSPPNKVTGWQMAVYSHRLFDAVHMQFQYDVTFADAVCEGAYTGLFADQNGTWLVLLDTDAGFRYRDEQGYEVLLVDRSLLGSWTRYTVKVSKSHVNTMMLELNEEDVPIYQGEYVPSTDFTGFHFGALQKIDGATSAKNIFIDDIFWMGGFAAPLQAASLAVFPNPFNAETAIEFTMPAAGRVVAEIVDVSGARVRRIYAGDLEHGPHRMLWDGSNDRGRQAASGIYFLFLRTGGGTRTNRLALMR